MCFCRGGKYTNNYVYNCGAILHTTGKVFPVDGMKDLRKKKRQEPLRPVADDQHSAKAEILYRFAAENRHLMDNLPPYLQRSTYLN